MRELPKLAHCGFWGKKTGDFEKKDTVFDTDKIEKIKCFIVENIGRRKTINREASSYNLKHIIEDLIDGYDYISNGECIKAFIELGFNVSVSGGLNAFFNIDGKDLAAIRHKRQMKIYANL